MEELFLGPVRGWAAKSDSQRASVNEGNQCNCLAAADLPFWLARQVGRTGLHDAAYEFTLPAWNEEGGSRVSLGGTYLHTSPQLVPHTSVPV